MGVFLRLSISDNSLVGGPVWLKFELLLDSMHVLYTYKFKIDQINSDREKWQHRFLDAQGQLTVVRDRIWPNFKLIQAHVYVIITCKYEKDPIKNSYEKVATPFYP